MPISQLGKLRTQKGEVVSLRQYIQRHMTNTLLTFSWTPTFTGLSFWNLTREKVTNKKHREQTLSQSKGVRCTAQTFIKPQSNRVRLQRPLVYQALFQHQRQKFDPQATGTLSTHRTSMTVEAINSQGLQEELHGTQLVIKHPGFGVRPVTYSLKWEKPARQGHTAGWTQGQS